MPGPVHFRSLALPLLLILSLWLLFFWPMMAGQEIAGYRDSSYLYYPMFQWIDQEIAAGNFPLWMPFDDLGFPLLADGTSSMLYPGKLVFHLRFLSFPSRYGIYLAMHVLLAALGAFWLSRTLKARPWGACLAAISFAFGGSLLFQVCNVIYLVSGAWLPVALSCIWKMLDQHQKRPFVWAIAAGALCAMMILGGDPQMVYHVGLIALFSIVCFALKGLGHPFRQNLASLVIIVVVTSGLAAAQLIPTFQWTQHSDRMSSPQPLTLWQAVVGEDPSVSLTSLAKRPEGPPLTDVYQFSQEPWTVLEFLWSGIFGADAPVNTRWTAAFPGAERLWMPSVYFGTIPFVLALSGIRFWQSKSSNGRKGRAGQVWLTWIAVCFMLASFGWYGPVWLAKELSLLAGDDWFEGSFGVYWLMVTLLPKYILFRYPAKLVVVAVLALCVLAGIQTRPRSIIKNTRFWLGLSVFSLMIALVMLLPTMLEQLGRCHSTGIYGPFQATLCQRAIVFSLLKTAFFAGSVCTFCFLLKQAVDRNKFNLSRSYLRNISCVLALLIAFDLFISNRWMLHPVPTSIINGPVDIAARIKDDRAKANLDPAMLLSIDRSDTIVNFDPQWHETPSPNRIAEIAHWRRESLFPKTHLDIPNLEVLGSFCSIIPAAIDRSPGAKNRASLFEIFRTADGFVTATDSQPTLRWNQQPRGNAWLERPTANPEDPILMSCDCYWRGGSLTVRLPKTPTKNQTDSDLRLIIRMLTVPGWSAYLLDDKGQTKASLPIERRDDFHFCVPIRATYSKIKLVYRPIGLRFGLAVSAVSILATLAYLLIEFRTTAPQKDDGNGRKLS